MNKTLVRIVIGSKSDLEQCLPIQTQLQQFGIASDFFISSAHRNPEKTITLAKEAEQLGIQVIIACAGMAAHLPGIIAANTTLPVIGVPLSNSALNGEDALFSIVQMPTGVPVATVAINGIKNAAILAAEIIALNNEEVKQKLKQFREELAQN
ncbi:MAG TPA: 5-(carboxyamino)imidazole ribonucleotide mutase [Candidatus Cloacimonadota bacterium]|nr:5-(carboxyamino)imidazole ribonucleotide mutase [Candidatus Cloacimonadota bacterium]